MRMHDVEVLDGRRQLSHHGLRISQVHAAGVVPFAHVDEALGHLVTLWAAYRRRDRLEVQALCDGSPIVCDVCRSVVGQELQRAAIRYGLHRSESLLHRFLEDLVLQGLLAEDELQLGDLRACSSQPGRWQHRLASRHRRQGASPFKLAPLVQKAR
jgi:hypothetical protein